MPSPAPRTQISRFLLLFPITLVLGFALLQTAPAGALVGRFTEGIVHVSAGLIHLFGGRVLVIGRILQSPANGFAVEVQNGCNAVNVTILLWAAIATYPARWSRKAGGLLWGTLAIHVVNLLRVISLFYLGQYNYNWFEFAHMYLWESLIVLDTLAVFWIWASLVRKSMVHANAGAS
jgi:exosortase H (IPTLxxWG-CTERM-specific)